MQTKSQVQQTITCKVPCQFGGGLHDLTLGLDQVGRVRFITCECERNPPDPEAVRVAKALNGGIVSCLGSVGAARVLLKLDTFPDSYDVLDDFAISHRSSSSSLLWRALRQGHTHNATSAVANA